jgi:hypothetical protein
MKTDPSDKAQATAANRGRRARAAEDGYLQPPWERVAAVLAAALILGLVAFLVVRNEPFADPNLVVLVRTILSLAVAVLGGTIPGFLRVGWTVRGAVVRAGGALALFALTFLFTPQVMPSLGPAAIPPLKNPRKVESFDRMQVPRVVMAADQAPPGSAFLSVRAVYEGDAREQQKLFDVLLSNSSDSQRLVTKFRVRWLYAKGIFLSVDQGVSIRPVEKYSIAMNIDPDKTMEMIEKAIDVYPPLTLPPKNASGPSVTSIRLELLYTFDGARLQYHPAQGWDIYYQVDVEDESGASARVLSRTWQGHAKPNWVDEYREWRRKRGLDRG